jgi:selenocysteine-specific elongation factor
VRAAQLAARFEALADRDRLLGLHTAERGAVAIRDAHAVTGAAPARPPSGVDVLDDHYVDADHLRRWADAIRDALAAHHATHPLARTAPRAVVDRAVAEQGCPASVIDDVVTWCEDAGLVTREAAGLRLPDHRVALDDDQQRARDALLAALDASPFAPPSLSDAAASAGVSRPLLTEMESAGQVVRLAPDIAMTASAIDEATALLRTAAVDGPLTASGARQVLGTSRKYVLPLLEELDRRGVTRRQGDTRAFV